MNFKEILFKKTLNAYDVMLCSGSEAPFELYRSLLNEMGWYEEYEEWRKDPITHPVQIKIEEQPLSNETKYGKIKLNPVHSNSGEFEIVCETESGIKTQLAFIKIDNSATPFVSTGPSRVKLEKFSTLHYTPEEIDRVKIELLTQDDILGLDLENVWLGNESYDKSLVSCVNKDGIVADSRPDTTRHFIPKITLRIEDSTPIGLYNYINLCYGASNDGALYRIINCETESHNCHLVTVIPLIKSPLMYWEERNDFLKYFAYNFRGITIAE